MKFALLPLNYMKRGFIMSKQTIWQKIARKLCSRKLWLSIVAFVSGIMIQYGATQQQVDNIGGAIMSGAAVLAYCIGEGLADYDNKKK